VQDLTKGSITRHLIQLSVPIGVGMLFQTLYYLVDLYFVARLGGAAIAGVSSAGNVQFIVLALTQVLGIGTMALIAHAVGRKDPADANLVFNQSLVLAALCAAIVLALGYAFGDVYMNRLGADAETAAAGTAYLQAYLPALALQFALVSMGSALRGTGIAKPTMVVQVVSVLLNAVLAPVLITGWITHHPLGVFGAGLASSIAVAVGVVMLWIYYVQLERFVGFHAGQLAPRLEVWKRILKIGLPPGGEFVLLFVYLGVIYWITRDAGAHAQAGFGVGSRLMQAIFLPAMAVAFAVAPLAGQNMGAGRHDRVRRSFRVALLASSVLMFSLTLFCQFWPHSLVGAFSKDAEVVAVASQFLGIILWNFVAQGIIFTCGGLFQALGNTLPSLASSATRILSFAIPGIWMSQRPGFELRHLWFLSVATVTLQALLSWLLLRREFARKLQPAGTLGAKPQTMTTD